MTQEEKQPVFKDLCARLPYGVKVRNVKNNFDINNFNHNVEEIKILIEEYNIKPYLRPMSSMTEREKEEFQYIAGGKILDNCIVRDGYGINYDTISKIEDWLNAHHFDYRGLIEKGLALEALEYMYKTE